MDDINKLLEIMALLRHPDDGCEWDKRQDFDSIAPHTIEEAYEVADAIRRRNWSDLCDELGDMLFQVVYHARLAEEKGAFSFPDVISGVCQKLRDRHPQIFAAGQGHQPDQASEGDVWELRKITARKKREASQLLADVPPALPALSTASKYGKRAAAVGFDWKDSRQVVSKVREELAELEEAIQQGSSTHIEEEIGDLLFTVANLSRHLDTDAETALRLGNAKFARRFHAMETQIDASNRPWPEWEDEELEQAWSEIKSRESAAN